MAVIGGTCSGEKNQVIENFFMVYFSFELTDQGSSCPERSAADGCRERRKKSLHPERIVLILGPDLPEPDSPDKTTRCRFGETPYILEHYFSSGGS